MKKYLFLLIPIIGAVLAIWFDNQGIINRLENVVIDNLFQSPVSLQEDKIVILGIDQKSLEKLGPFHQWKRSDMAEALRILNADPDRKPAVIGVDIMYFGYTDPKEDQALVEVCKENKNIVMASYVKFETGLVTVDSGEYYMDRNRVGVYEEPFLELSEATDSGMINGVIDQDGVVRRCVHSVTLPDGRQVPSFANMIYQKYAKFSGLDPFIEPPMDELNQWFIPFRGGPGDYYDGYSFADLLSGELSPERFAGKIVLIGPFANGLLDEYRTSIDSSKLMYGVEIHANIIDVLIHNEFKQYVEAIYYHILLCLIIFLGILLFRSIRLRFIFVIWIVSTAGYVMLAKLAYEKGYIMRVSMMLIVLTLLLLTAVVFYYVAALKEKRKVVTTFKRYVASEVVDEIFKSGLEHLELGGRLTEVACLFVDIRNFTTISEQLPPNEVVNLLNQYLDLTSSCILEHGGMLDKFMGDATMAVFNAPLPQEDYLYQAVLAALDMINGAEPLNKKFNELYQCEIGLGIGIHCGKAVVGNIGTKMHMDYTAIGDTVNTAARLETVAASGSIYISRQVYEQLLGRIFATSLGSTIVLKGKKKEIEIFNVTGVEK